MAKRKPVKRTTHYTLLHEISASPTEPLPLAWRTTQLFNMWDGLADLEKEPNPDLNSWRVCSDAVNLLEMLVHQEVAEDTQGLLDDATEALAVAGQRYRKTGAPLRLTGQGIQALRAVLEDYAELLGMLPARTMIRCHRLTEKRIHEVLSHKRPNGVAVMVV